MYIGPVNRNLIIPPISIVSSSTNRSTRSIVNSQEDLLMQVNSINEPHTSSFDSTVSMPSNQFRKDTLRSLRSQYHVNQYDNINIQLDNLESSTELLLCWSMDVSVVDLLKNPIIVLNDE